MREKLFEIWFSLRCGVANREFIPVLEQCGSAYQVFNADENELEHLPCSEKLKRALADHNLEEASRIAEYCEHHGIGVMFWQDEAYPSSLRTLIDPPVLLYYRGQWPDLAHRLCVSVVGTRKMSEYGRRMAYKIGYELGATGTIVVSGMALGIDSVAAAGVIAAGGTTIAVLGCGINVTYPREHEVLSRRITECGVLISEYPPSTPPAGSNFPVRNRIISGLSQATLVVEADDSSGALITARNAILQGREIYAVPGNVGESNTSGTNRLIRDGAAVALCARDILNNFVFLYKDYLHMERLLGAEKRSDVDDRVLDRLGVCYRTVRPPREDPAGGEHTAGPQATSRSRQRQTTATPPDGGRHRAPSVAGEQTPSPTAPIRHPVDTPDRTSEGDASGQLLASLTPNQRRMLELLPLDHAVPVDVLTREGYPVGEVLSAMTLLEIKGLVGTLPGGLYYRK